MWALIFKAAGWLLGLLPGGKKEAGFADGRELGRAEQQNADLKGGMDTVRRATEAARKAEQEQSDEPDPMDRANGR